MFTEKQADIVIYRSIQRNVSKKKSEKGVQKQNRKDIAQRVAFVLLFMEQNVKNVMSIAKSIIGIKKATSVFCGKRKENAIFAGIALRKVINYAKNTIRCLAKI